MQTVYLYVYYIHICVSYTHMYTIHLYVFRIPKCILYTYMYTIYLHTYRQMAQREVKTHKNQCDVIKGFCLIQRPSQSVFCFNFVFGQNTFRRLITFLCFCPFQSDQKEGWKREKNRARVHSNQCDQIGNVSSPNI